MDQHEKKIVRAYLEEDLRKIMDRARIQAMRDLNGDAWPSKSKMKVIEMRPDYPERLNHYIMQLDTHGVSSLLSNEDHWTEDTLSAILTSCYYNQFREDYIQKEKEDLECETVRQFLEKFDLKSAYSREKEALIHDLRKLIEQHFLTNDGLVYPEWNWDAGSKWCDEPEGFIWRDTDQFDDYLSYVLDSDDYIADDPVRAIAERSKCEYTATDRVTNVIKERYLSKLTTDAAKSEIRHKVCQFTDEDECEIIEEVSQYFDRNTVVELLMRNPAVVEVINRRKLAEQEKERAEMSILDHIPDKYADLYPAARKMRRRFVLHVGPTNSGKTHDAVQALEKAGNGVYLGPLRLLAYEQYEKMNAGGFPCSLLTGEERADVPGAQFTASTIEMANYSAVYAAAVIDEAQMISDRARGGAWTAAILGIRAKEIHVCMSEDAEQLIIRLIGECGDTYTVVRHERKTPLICEGKWFNYPDDVQNGDALIVFSRQNVHAVAAELQEKGFKCSIIYGALPYTVRHKQAELFATGQNHVIVATDAIGMGMNLPIRRVVFLEHSKYDGQTNRNLLPCEIKQIAGRAGRLGMYDEGYVEIPFDFPIGKKGLRKMLARPDEPLTHAVIAFPEVLIGIDARLSTILERWIAGDVQNGYKKAVAEREAMLCREMEVDTNDKQFIYRFITIPFDENNEELFGIWKSMYKSELKRKTYPVESKLAKIDKNTDDLQILEENYRICDLLYTYCDRFSHSEYVDEIQSLKDGIAGKITDTLSKTKLKQRKCKYCGTALPWNYPYGMCQDCHDEMYPSRRRYWEDDEYDDIDNDDDWN